MKNYGSLQLTEASPAQSFAEPMALGELRHYLKLETPSPSDAEEDALLNTYITTAREVAEIFQGIDLISKQWDLHLDWFYEGEIELRQPLTSVDLINYKDSDGNTTAMTENTDYIVDLVRGIVLPPYGLTWPNFTPWPSSAILCRFTSGYSTTHQFWSDTGKRILSGMKLLIALWYEERLPFKELGNISEIPYGVQALLGFGAKHNIR